MPKTLLDYPPVENIYNIKLGRYTKSNYQNILNANRSRLIGRKGSLLGRQMRNYTRTFSFPWRLAWDSVQSRRQAQQQQGCIWKTSPFFLSGEPESEARKLWMLKTLGNPRREGSREGISQTVGSHLWQVLNHSKQNYSSSVNNKGSELRPELSPKKQSLQVIQPRNLPTNIKKITLIVEK